MRSGLALGIGAALILSACARDSEPSVLVTDDVVSPDDVGVETTDASEQESDEGPDTTAPQPDPGPLEPEPDPVWDPVPAPPACATNTEGPMLDEALQQAGLDRASFRFDLEADLAHSGYYTGGALDDPFLLPWFRPVQFAPAEADCWAQGAVVALDEVLDGDHPVAGAIRHAAGLLDRWEEADPALQTVPMSLGQAIQNLCIAASEVGVNGPCDASGIDLEPDLDQALARVVQAIAETVPARAAAVAPGLGIMSESAWMMNGDLGMTDFAQYQHLQNPVAVEFLVGESRRGLYVAAARLAHVIESIDWTVFRGRMGPSVDVKTPLGWIRVRDAADHEHQQGADSEVLIVDLGGDDTWIDGAGANTHGQGGVNVAIDVSGADHYTYEAIDEGVDGLMPTDAAGRYTPDGSFGPITLSRVPRQGAARNGVAFLFDLAGSDRYESLTHSQGYAHLGVGVLFDGGGEDAYRAEASSQGAGVFGIGLLIDRGGANDSYRSWNRSQGSASMGGLGALHDAGGDDAYWLDPGNADGLGQALYGSPQMPGVGNTSMGQGASTGIRWDAGSTWTSGGLGILRDVRGDDTYVASLFAQGAGYWQGTGVLSDGDGADTYDAYWYVQGGAAHYATGMLLDGGDGDDVFNGGVTTRSVQQGSGHDYSLGLMVNEGGNDTYHFSSLSLGASNCNGIGVFVDNGGDDRYEGESTSALGVGNVSSECLGTRPEAVSIGVFLDAGGADTYVVPDTFDPTPADDTFFGHVTHDLPSEHGAALDAAQGDTGIRAR